MKISSVTQMLRLFCTPTLTYVPPSNSPYFRSSQAEFDPPFEFTQTYDDGTNRASFNNITYQMPTSTPSMLTELTMGNDAFNPAVYGAMTNAFTYPHMAIVQLTVFNWDAGFHPFHLHGYVFFSLLFSSFHFPLSSLTREHYTNVAIGLNSHEFQLVSKSFDVTSNDTTINPPLDETQRSPARRDTVVIPPTGMVVLRWRADNPGAWMFHCHVRVLFPFFPSSLQTQLASLFCR